MAAYRDALRAQEERTRKRDEAAKAHANRVLTDEEYYQQALEREAQKQAQAAERQAEEQRKKEEKAAYLASLPDVAEVSERSEFLFLQGVIHRAKQGYILEPNGIDAFMLGFYSCRMVKPEAPARKTK